MDSCDFLFTVDEAWAGQRLDRFIAAHGEETGLSRSAIKKLIEAGKVTVNDQICKVGSSLSLADRVILRIPSPEPSGLHPEPVDFVIIFEDEDLVVVNKPAGLVVHPAPGHSGGTLVNGLLYHCHDLSGIGGEERPGIVHRLDRDTSGVMVVAKNDAAHRSLAAQFAGRKVEKEYLAILEAIPPTDLGTVDSPIGRHPVKRKKMAVVARGGRKAVTHWRLLESLTHDFSLVRLRLETGRTHQIRVHMASIKVPVAGDPVYGGRKKKLWPELAISRQMLHAARLSFDHPGSGERVEFEAGLWPDMEKTLRLLGGEYGR